MPTLSEAPPVPPLIAPDCQSAAAVYTLDSRPPQMHRLYVPKRESLVSGRKAHLAYDLVSAGVLAQVDFNVIVQRVCMPGERPPVLQNATEMCRASQILSWGLMLFDSPPASTQEDKHAL